jgi:hypothetical protein
VNPDAYNAIHNRQLHKYIAEQHIRYIMDADLFIYALCMRYAGHEMQLNVAAKDEKSGFGLWIVSP